MTFGVILSKVIQITTHGALVMLDLLPLFDNKKKDVGWGLSLLAALGAIPAVILLLIAQ